MFTSLNFEINEQQWRKFFTAQNLRLLSPDSLTEIKKGIVTASNGIIYFLDGIFVLTDSKNNAFEVIITDPQHFGVTIIDVQKTSQIQKKLAKEMKNYLTRLHSYLVGLAKDDVIDIDMYNDRKINDLKEQILIEHSL